MPWGMERVTRSWQLQGRDGYCRPCGLCLITVLDLAEVLTNSKDRELVGRISNLQASWSDDHQQQGWSAWV